MANFQDKERILKAARWKKEVTYKGAPIRLATDFSMETLQVRREWQKNIPSNENQRPATKTTLPRKALNQDRRPNKEIPRQKKKSKRIHLHQTSSARDAKWTAVRKGRKREREREREEHRYKKMAMNKYLSIITLNVNGLNAPIKRHRIAEWIRKQDPHICCLQETHLRTKDFHRLKVKG